MINLLPCNDTDLGPSWYTVLWMENSIRIPILFVLFQISILPWCPESPRFLYIKRKKEDSAIQGMNVLFTMATISSHSVHVCVLVHKFCLPLVIGYNWLRLNYNLFEFHYKNLFTFWCHKWFSQILPRLHSESNFCGMNGYIHVASAKCCTQFMHTAVVKKFACP